MLNSKDIKEQLDEDSIISILELLGCSFIKNENNCLICETICHHGNSHKLYYYKDSKTFYCYTECGSMDIFGLIENSLRITFYDAVLWLQKYFNFKENSNSKNCISDWNFIKSYKKNNSDAIEKKVTYYDNKIFNIFQKIYYQGWIDEGISIESMINYNIMYCAFNQQIIIPHYDVANNLIGIRARNLNDNLNIKYIPFYDGNIIYKHSLGDNLYGLNKNKDTIEKKRKVMIVESEKSVMQCDTMFGKDNFTVAICGSHLTKSQLKILFDLNVNEIILALDKQFQQIDDKEYIVWQQHINNIAEKILPYCKVSIIWDTFNLLNYKDSPSDQGKKVLLKLLENKIYL